MTSWAGRLVLSLLLLLHGTRVATQPSGALRPLVGATLTGTVTAVIDGDTFDIAIDGRPAPLRVRIFGIDAPERGEPYSNVALRQARALLFNQRATLVGRDVDRYDRLVASVNAGGVDVGVSLIEAGLACHFTRYSNEARLAEAEALARSRGAGFWAPGAPRPRCASAAISSPPGLSQPRSLAERAAATGPFRGNTNSHLYHAPHCRNYRCRNCTQVFASEAEARQAGYRPAQDCLK